MLETMKFFQHLGLLSNLEVSHQIPNSLSGPSNHRIFSHLEICNEIRCSLDSANKCGTSPYSDIIITKHKTIRSDTPQQTKFRESKVGDLNASAGGQVSQLEHIVDKLGEYR
jgi:hypothetical protein